MYIKAIELENLDRQLFLQTQLLELLAEGAVMTKGALAEKLQLDVRSLQRLMEVLTKNYQAFTETQGSLFIGEQNQIRLKIAGEALEQEQFLLYLIRHTLAFQLTEQLLLGKANRIKDLSQKLFVSQSTIRRKLTEIAPPLAPLEPTMEQGEILFKAPEGLVGMYLSVYYWRLFKGKDWPFNPIQKKLVREISQAIQVFFAIKLNPIKAGRLEYLIGALLLRGAQKNTGELRTKYVVSIIKNDLFQAFYQKIAPLMPPYFQNPPTIANLFLSLLTREEYYQKRQAEIIALLTPAPFYLVAEKNEVLNHLLPQLTPEQRNVVAAAENYLLSGHLYNRLFPTIPFNINGKIFWRQLTQQASDTAAFVSQALIKLGPVKEDSVLFGRYLNLLKQLRLDQGLPLLRILLQTDLPEFEEEILKNKLQQFLQHDYCVLFTEEQASDYQLSVTTSLFYDTGKKRVPTLFVTEELEMEDYLQLFTLLRKS